MTALELGHFLTRISTAMTVPQLVAIEEDLKSAWSDDVEAARTIARMLARRQQTLAKRN